uniref:Uncharacterized protein n=1 Tax=Tanacetum cinerariifolium TaxID=118510 RepID=A0A699IMC3_TANCI|nr:hypothetical protein [Tanacetum cinerariifolium]
MVTILEKYEHNVDFHHIVDFVEASHIRRNLKLKDKEGINTLPDAELFENLALMGYNIFPNKKFTFQKDEPTSPLGDDSQGEACPTVTGLEAGQNRANIIKTSSLPHDSTPRVTSLAADEGSMQQQLNKLMDLCTRLQRQQSEMATKFAAQELEIASLKARIKLLEDKDGGGSEPSKEDATIKRRKQVGVQVVSVPPAAEVSTIGIPTGSGMVPIASPIFTTASMVTPYARHKGKEKMVESDTPKKKKLQEHIDVQMLIDGLDRNNETVAKYLQEYEQFAADLSIREKIDMINELVKYQDHHLKILKYQAQQSKPLSKKQQREFYMPVLKSHSGWKILSPWLLKKKEKESRGKGSVQTSSAGASFSLSSENMSSLVVGT